ncbi:prolyl-tRNA synthetase [Saccharata proteae CBS 121410]|uniref:proline--tRNA ligase n=1 Tax=Saccharata proteae CBS 121410 TaxID=1314787 RepID=A0A6A5YC09_9PEZI|nr:prolyl-tRNA synthetase [Saccharata proteae CBS 121410]
MPVCRIWSFMPWEMTLSGWLFSNSLTNGGSFDGRNRLTNFWAPTGGITPGTKETDHSHALLVRAGFLRQAHAGIFHFLPLGLRVQEKLERLIDKHMRSIGASKVSLSSLSTEELWRKTGRLDGDTKELLRVKDRKDSGLLLGPTHEEEITSLVSSFISSWRHLPVRLYQISRKYRDEKRPRQGLLRAKEFLMKDLYTFDVDEESALQTYKEVQRAYEGIFGALKLPFIKANADSGAIGGDLSHEWHFVSSKGEDNVGICRTCKYSANEELLAKKHVTPTPEANLVNFYGISRDKKTLVAVTFPSNSVKEDSSEEKVATMVNIHAVKAAFPSIDTALVGSNVLTLWGHLLRTSGESGTIKVVRLKDRGVPQDALDNFYRPEGVHNAVDTTTIYTNPKTGLPLDLTLTKSGDPCPKCSEPLEVVQAIEAGHTFHLGTRYSAPLNVNVETNEGRKLVQMGCHGIGVSRMIGAVAALLADGKGLNWPRAIAPFQVAILGESESKSEMNEVYDGFEAVGWDSIIDDRDVKITWKLKDADLIGYSVVVVFGRRWKDGQGLVEVQCRRLNRSCHVHIEDLRLTVGNLLEEL